MYHITFSHSLSFFFFFLFLFLYINLGNGKSNYECQQKMRGANWIKWVIDKYHITLIVNLFLFVIYIIVSILNLSYIWGGLSSLVEFWWSAGFA